MNEVTDKNKLPEDWKWVKLKEIAEITSSRRIFQNEYVNEGIPFYRTKEVKELSEGKLLSVELFISNEKYEEIKSKNQLPKVGDVLLSAVGTIGISYVIKDTKPFYFKDGNLLWVRKFDKLDSKYLHYLFEHYIKFKQGIATSGSAYNALTIIKLKEFKVPLPSKEIQQAIVSKIEELFSELDKSIETLRLAQQQLKTYRQAVLKWAFEGKLTEINATWKNVRLGDVANAIDPQPSHRTPPIDPNGIPFVSIKDFDYELDKIDFTYARRVSRNVLEEHIERYKLEAGDFVIGKIGTIGKPVRIVLPQNYCLSANIVLIQPRKIDTTYLYYFFQSSLIEKAFTAGVKATTQAAFGIQKVRELRIELPNDKEQTDIVQEIESRLSVAEKMEESILQSLQQADALRQSILKKSFEGNLI